MTRAWCLACLFGCVPAAVSGCERSPTAVRSRSAVPAHATAESTPSAAESAALQPGAGAPAQPGASPPVLDAPVHLPHLAAGQKAPLLLMLHSIGTSAEDIERRTDWPKFAERHGIAWMAPNGSVNALGHRFWDAGPSCCNFTGAPVDHVTALRALLERVLDDHPIDRERVFVGGISNGGFMAHRLGCSAPDLVRGVVSISGAGPLEGADCQTPVSLRVLQIHGDADPVVAPGGGHLFNNPSLPKHASVQQTVGDWASRLRCKPDPVPAGSIDLEERFPGNETRVSRYQDCQLGQLELWTVEGGDHYLAFHDPTPELVWQFLSR